MSRLYPIATGCLVGLAMVLTWLALAIDPAVPAVPTAVVWERTALATRLVVVTAVPTTVPTAAPSWTPRPAVATATASAVFGGGMTDERSEVR